jgi:hypothetical protein
MISLPKDRASQHEHEFEHPWPKECSCCSSTFEEHEWRLLRYVGKMRGIELRNCECNSTLAVKLKEKESHHR